jgi:hypothetical protein
MLDDQRKEFDRTLMHAKLLEAEHDPVVQPDPVDRVCTCYRPRRATVRQSSIGA